MGLDGVAMVGIIASGTTQYVSEFSPILYFVGGILLAFGVMNMLINMIMLRRENTTKTEENFFDDNPSN